MTKRTPWYGPLTKDEAQKLRKQAEQMERILNGDYAKAKAKAKTQAKARARAKDRAKEGRKE